MATIVLKKAADFEVFPADYYVGTVDSVVVENKQPDNYHKEEYQQLRWVWLISVPDRDDKPKFSTWTSLSMHEKSKLPGLLKALGVEVGEDEDGNPVLPDTDELVGLRCRLNIVEKLKQDGTAKNQCEGYAPLPRRAAGRPAPKPAPAPADDDGDLAF